MNNNDILRRLRYTFNFDDHTMIKLFGSAELEVTRAEISDWLKKDDNPEQQKLHDKKLAYFLNGFINQRRGKREGPQPKAEKRLDNNLIMRKLKIALNLRTEDIVAILKLADLKVSEHEVTAIFRKPGQRQFRECKDQFLRNFLHGMQVKYRDEANKSKE